MLIQFFTVYSKRRSQHNSLFYQKFSSGTCIKTVENNRNFSECGCNYFTVFWWSKETE